MSSPDVYSTVKGFLQTQFSPTPVVDFDQIDASLEQGDASFLLLDEVSGDEAMVCFGSATDGIGQRETGVITVECFIPGPEESVAARNLAESVRDTMRHQRLSGVHIIEVTAPEPVRRNEGRWTSYAVALGFRTDFFVSLPAAVP